MARTKQTGKATAKTNGAPKPRPNAAKSIKAATQPTELSEADRGRIKNWLDRQERCPFEVYIARPSLKRKRDSGLQTQTDLFEDRLSVPYEVRPRDKWECLRRYKKFTVGSESIAVGQYILVKHDDSEDARIDVAAQWKAKVLEVRALDSEHVYIRLAWLNRPEDLSGGRQSYHGKNELIPTNQMDVIDAMAVNGSLDVIHWDERDDESSLAREDQFFWRQTFDFAVKKTFSELRKICIDSTPQNPDELILQCGNQACRRWQHVKCVAEDAVQKAAGEASGASRAATKKAPPKHVSIGAKSLAQAKAQTGSFTAEVLIKGLPHTNGRPSATATEIITTNADDEKRSHPVRCLFCAEPIENEACTICLPSPHWVEHAISTDNPIEREEATLLRPGGDVQNTGADVRKDLERMALTKHFDRSEGQMEGSEV